MRIIEFGACPGQLYFLFSASFLDGITHFLSRKNRFRARFSEFIRGYYLLADSGSLGTHGAPSSSAGLLSCVAGF